MEKDFNNIDEKSLIDDERIAKYLKGKMTADEEQAFMRELETNAELKEKSIAMARIAKAMKEVGTANDKEVVEGLLASDYEEIKEVISDATKENVAACAMPADYINSAAEPASAQKRSLRRSLTWLSAVASVALLIWAGIGYNDYRSTTGLGNEYATAFTSSQLNRGGETYTDVEKKLTLLFDNVIDGRDLKSTIHDLTLCWELSTQETYNDYTDFAPEIGWNLAISHLKNNDRKQAKAVLEKLTTIVPAGSAISDKARELLKKVDE